MKNGKEFDINTQNINQKFISPNRSSKSKGEELTIERLKQIKGLEHFTETEYYQAKETIEKLCALLVKMMKDQLLKRSYNNI